MASAVDKLNAIEFGMDEPSRAVLAEMARLYRRPLLTFYLAKPPAKGDRGADFRTLPPDHAVADEALLDALVRDIRVRQSMLRTVIGRIWRRLNGLHLLDHTGFEDGAAAVLASIQSLL